MVPFQATAVRVCGVPVLVLIAGAAASGIELAMGTSVVPGLQLSTGVAVWVAVAGLCLANVRSQQAAESVSLSAAAVIAVLAVVSVYKIFATPVLSTFPTPESLNVLDGAIFLALLGGMALMCSSVWRGRRPAAG